MGGVVGGVVSAGMSLFGASSAASAAQAQLEAAAAAAEASAQATASGIIAGVYSQNQKLEDYATLKEIMTRQAVADASIRHEKYNKLSASQMVVTAAQGRQVEGSAAAYIKKGYADYAWDQMWNADTIQQGLTTIEKDKRNILEAGKIQLEVGLDQIEAVKRGGSAQMQGIASSANNAITDAYVSAGKGLIGAFGGLFDG